MNWKRGKRSKPSNKLTSFGSWGKILRERDLAKDARWQEMEREVDEHILRGEIATFEDSQAFMAYLDKAIELMPSEEPSSGEEAVARQSVSLEDAMVQLGFDPEEYDLGEPEK